jgi:LacI family transcriptional regulator
LLKEQVKCAVKNIKRPTSKDVAEVAGVSRTTVSYVINEKTGGNIRISDETRKKVWDAVKKLNYQPITAARTLRTNRSNLLALMVPHIETPFHPLLAAAIQNEIEDSRFDLIVYGTRDDYQHEKAFLDSLLRRGVEGVIMQTFQLTEEEIDSLVRNGIAVVVLGESPTHPFIDNVVLDEAQAVEEVVTYIIDKGHRRIGTITGPEGTWCGRIRKEGYLRALKVKGISIEDELIVEADFFDGESAGHAMQRLLSLPNPPTAVFVASDMMAVKAQNIALDLGLAVPEDIAIVGFNDIPLAVMTRPRLTTIRKDVDQLSAAAIKLLLERIESETQIPSRQVVLGHEIVYRESA